MSSISHSCIITCSQSHSALAGLNLRTASGLSLLEGIREAKRLGRRDSLRRHHNGLDGGLWSGDEVEDRLLRGGRSGERRGLGFGRRLNRGSRDIRDSRKGQKSRPRLGEGLGLGGKGGLDNHGNGDERAASERRVSHDRDDGHDGHNGLGSRLCAVEPDRAARVGSLVDWEGGVLAGGQSGVQRVVSVGSAETVALIVDLNQVKKGARSQDMGGN